MKINNSNDIKDKISDYFISIGCLVVLTIFVYKAILANIDLTGGRFALFMDERITFDGVKKILNPDGIKEFLISIGHGSDHRYGRILWYSMAIFSAVPEYFFGDTGQIIASRVLQVLLIVASYFTFAFGILRSWFFRFVLLVVMMAMPFSDYYMTMPKPEPLQILFLSIFALFFVKKKADFSWYWIFAGLAFGTKISTLPALFVFVLISLLSYSQKNLSIFSGKSLLDGVLTFIRGKSLIKAVLPFSLGLSIAVPILLVPLGLSIGGVYILFLLRRKFDLNAFVSWFIAMIGASGVFLVSYKILKVWISSTFLNTTHGADQASVNAISWIKYFFDQWLVAPPLIGFLLMLYIISYLLFFGIKTIKSDGFVCNKKLTVIAIAIAGLALNVSIFIASKRLWGFYLYPGTLMMIAGTLSLADFYITESTKVGKWYSSISKVGSYLLSILLLMVATFYWMPKTMSGLEKLSNRTDMQEYKIQYTTYKKYMNHLVSHKNYGKKTLHVMISPWLFVPVSDKNIEFDEFFGGFTKWDVQPDVIIFSRKEIPSESTSIEQAYKNEYETYVVDKTYECLRRPCYVRELRLPNGEVLVLSDEDD